MGAPMGNRNAAGSHKRGVGGRGIPKGFKIRRRGGGNKSPFQKTRGKRGTYRKALRGGKGYGFHLPKR